MRVKYELLKDDNIEVEGHTLYRIRATKRFNDVKKGDLGGYIENEENLGHYSNCWVYDNADSLYNIHLAYVIVFTY